jgi:hypothetical protein
VGNGVIKMEFVKDWECNGTIMVRCTMMAVLIYGISHESLSKLADLETQLSVSFVVARCPVDIIALPAFLCIIESSGIAKDEINESGRIRIRRNHR